jgi:multimeric flavodoxin WrbA
MKAVVLNGMESGNGSAGTISDLLAEVLAQRAWDVRPFDLRDLEIRPCGGCFGCWLQTPGRCLVDDTDDIAAAVTDSDLTVYLSPATFGGYSSRLKKVLDHLIFLILPFFQTVNGETHHVPRYRKRPNLLIAGVMDQYDAESEAIFLDLAEGNAVNLSAPRLAAGVIMSKQGRDAAREAIENSLAKMEVDR